MRNAMAQLPIMAYQKRVLTCICGSVDKSLNVNVNLDVWTIMITPTVNTGENRGNWGPSLKDRVVYPSDSLKIVDRKKGQFANGTS